MNLSFKQRGFLISFLLFLAFVVAFLVMFFCFDVPALHDLVVNPPKIRLDEVSYDTRENYVLGKVMDAEDPTQYGVIVFIHSGGTYFAKPYANAAVQKVNANGSIYVQAFTPGESGDKTADMYCVLLVDKNLDYAALEQEAASSDEPTPAWELARELAVDELWDLPTYN